MPRPGELDQRGFERRQSSLRQQGTRLEVFEINQVHQVHVFLGIYGLMPMRRRIERSLGMELYSNDGVGCAYFEAYHRALKEDDDDSPNSRY